MSRVEQIDVELTPAAALALRRLVGPQGNEPDERLAVIIGWLVRQPDVIQAEVLLEMPAELRRELGLLELARMELSSRTVVSCD